MTLFKCRHPAAMLNVVSTEPKITSHDANFNVVTFRFFCVNCAAEVNVSCLKLKGTAEEFFNMEGPHAPANQ